MMDPTRRQLLWATGAASTAGFASYSASGAQDDPNAEDDPDLDEDTEFNHVDIMFTRMMIPHHEGAIQMAELIPARTDRDELLELRTEIIEEQEGEIDLLCEFLDEADVPGCGEVGSMMPHEMPGMMHGMGPGMNGDGMDGDGMNGDGMDGDGMNGDGMDGDGMDGDGMDGDGMNGDGMHPDEMAEMMPREHMMTHDDRRALRRAEDQEFDCLFTDHMVRHHEGGVAMSEYVLDEGESDRVADLAMDSIDAQETEIDLMEEWRDDWNC